MTYDELSRQVEQLGYRDKLRLAQLLLRKARQEEEQQNPDRRGTTDSPTQPEPELVQYVAERLRKLKPSKKDAVLNSIGAMFQFRGGIGDADKEQLFAALVKARHITVMENNRVAYPD